jgi:hypothetical protein
VRNHSCCWVAPMMTGSPAHKALGKKQLTIRHCIHFQNTKDCGCLTGNLLATISRARRTIPAVGKRRTAQQFKKFIDSGGYREQ